MTPILTDLLSLLTPSLIGLSIFGVFLSFFLSLFETRSLLTLISSLGLFGLGYYLTGDPISGVLVFGVFGLSSLGVSIFETAGSGA